MDESSGDAERSQEHTDLQHRPGIATQYSARQL